jgi:hypothetical protein
MRLSDLSNSYRLVFRKKLSDRRNHASWKVSIEKRSVFPVENNVHKNLLVRFKHVS